MTTKQGIFAAKRKKEPVQGRYKLLIKGSKAAIADLYFSAERLTAK